VLCVALDSLGKDTVESKGPVLWGMTPGYLPDIGFLQVLKAPIR
jgi:hypothetical protein